MISELYALDEQLVSAYDTVVTLYVQSKVNGSENWNHLELLDSRNIVAESFELKNSICDSSELRIGGCIPSQLTFNLIVETAEDLQRFADLTSKRIIVKVQGRYRGEHYPSTELYPSDHLYPDTILTGEYILFIGQVDSVTKTNNYRIKKVVAFDRMYQSSKILCKNRIYKRLLRFDELTFSSWFSWIYNMGGNVPRTIYVSGVSELTNYDTVLDMDENLWQKIIEKNYSALDFVCELCELNGAFLIEDEYSESLISSNIAYPRMILPYNDIVNYQITNYYEISSYSDLQYEDYMTAEIRYVQLDFDGNNGYFDFISLPNYDKYSCYLSDNRLTKCISEGGLVTEILRKLRAEYSDDQKHKILGKIYQYRPFKTSIFNRWWVQVGDRIKLPTSDPDVPYVESIVLSRTLKGLYGMKVEIEAKGVEIMEKECDESIYG